MKVVNVRIDENQLHELDKMCELENRSRAELIRMAINSFLQKDVEDQKELAELQEQNKQLKMISKSMDLVLNEKEKRIEDNNERLKEIQNVQKLQKLLYENVLDQKDSTISQKNQIIELLENNLNTVNSLSLLERLFYKPVFNSSQ